MHIRKAKVEEWEKMRDVYLALLQTDPDAFADEYGEVAARTEEEWKSSLTKENGASFVAEANGVFIGMGRINFYTEIPEIPVLHKLGVLPGYRRQGIAKKLVTIREQWAKDRGAEKVRLYVIADRKQTIEFSKKNGYAEKEMLKNNIKKSDGSTVDVVVMEKDL